MTKILSFLLMGLIGFAASFAYSQDISGTDTPQASEEAEKYDAWIPAVFNLLIYDRDEPPQPNFGEPRSFYEYGGSSRKLGSENYISFSIRAYDSHWGYVSAYTEFHNQMKKNSYGATYGDISNGAIFPLLGSFYLIGNHEGTSDSLAYRIDEKSIPERARVRRTGIMFPALHKTVRNLDHWSSGQYDNTRIFIDEFSEDREGGDGIQVKITTEKKHRGPISDFANPHVDEKKISKIYKVGDLLEFESVALRLINIVPPGKEDISVRLFRDRDLPEAPEYQGRLAGWIEFDSEPVPKPDLADAQQNAANSTASENPDFFARYEKWLPERLIAPPWPIDARNGPPQPNLPDNMDFSGIGQIRDDERVFSLGVNAGAYRNENNHSPFDDFMVRLRHAGYQMSISFVPRYSVLPILGRFYCIDCPEGNENKKIWRTSASRLRPDEEPTDITLLRESIVFPIANSKQHVLSDGGGELYGYDVSLRDFVVNEENSRSGSVKIRLWHPVGSRQVREAWFKTGDVLEFHDRGHKIINIVMPRMLDEEIRGHKCFLVGYVELDPEPIPLENPHTEEITP